MGKEILSKVLTLFTASMGVVAALAWDEAIKNVFNVYYPRPIDGISPRFVYAIMVTCIFVIVTTLLAQATSKGKEKKG